MNSLPFSAPWLLAPMEGVTETCFRSLVLDRNNESALGGVFTEFVPVTTHPLRASHLRRTLENPTVAAAIAAPPGSPPPRWSRPVGLQLIGSNLECLAATASEARAAGAQVLDLNFGCPTKGALQSCAGSALLRDPARVELIIKTVVRAAAPLPVTAKLRAGFENDELIESLSRAVESAGAQMLTLHCRTRLEGYCKNVDWTRISRAVNSVKIPVCGNGGICAYSDLERMRRETGCKYVMVGRAALGDPWIFSNHAATAAEAADFLLSYAESLLAFRAFTTIGAASRVKQLLHFWTAGELITDTRAQMLRASPVELLTDIANRGGLELTKYSAIIEKLKGSGLSRSVSL